MQSLFGFHDTLEVVTNGVPAVGEDSTDALRTTHKDAKKKDCKAVFYIQSAVDVTNFDRIAHAKSTNEAWDILVKYYEGGEKIKVVKLQTLRRQYELLSMREDEKIAGYVSKVQKLVHLMKDCGETPNDKMVVEKVMRTLTSHFDHVILAIQESKNVETLKLKDFISLLEAREIRIIVRK